MWCRCSHSLEPNQGPQSNSCPQDPLTLLPPSLSPSLALILPSAPVSLSHSHSTNWHQWVDLVAALLAQGWAGWVGRGGQEESGRGLWLGWALPFSHPLGTGDGPMLAQVPANGTCLLNWLPLL